ncbi:MAG TPA: hypothetical protein QF353_04030 [Gammaproteobacteria bacterium]|nr:hypothetical protein [Gammaproteobacteria bacterium]
MVSQIKRTLGQITKKQNDVLDLWDKHWKDNDKATNSYEKEDDNSIKIHSLLSMFSLPKSQDRTLQILNALHNIITIGNNPLKQLLKDNMPKVLFYIETMSVVNGANKQKFIETCFEVFISENSEESQPLKEILATKMMGHLDDSKIRKLWDYFWCENNEENSKNTESLNILGDHTVELKKFVIMYFAQHTELAEKIPALTLMLNIITHATPNKTLESMAISTLNQHHETLDSLFQAETDLLNIDTYQKDLIQSLQQAKNTKKLNAPFMTSLNNVLIKLSVEKETADIPFTIISKAALQNNEYTIESTSYPSSTSTLTETNSDRSSPSPDENAPTLMTMTNERLSTTPNFAGLFKRNPTLTVNTTVNHSFQFNEGDSTREQNQHEQPRKKQKVTSSHTSGSKQYLASSESTRLAPALMPASLTIDRFNLNAYEENKHRLQSHHFLTVDRYKNEFLMKTTLKELTSALSPEHAENFNYAFQILSNKRILDNNLDPLIKWTRHLNCLKPAFMKIILENFNNIHSLHEINLLTFHDIQTINTYCNPFSIESLLKNLLLESDFYIQNNISISHMCLQCYHDNQEEVFTIFNVARYIDNVKNPQDQFSSPPSGYQL